MKTSIHKKAVAYLLSFLILISNLSPTFAMVNSLSNGGVNQFIDSPLSTNNNSGSIPVNQVDLSTGNVTLSETLFSIEGYDANLTYNSEGVSQKASIWNRDQKQGALGLGWEYPEDKIIRLTQQTGSLLDDNYLLYTKGNTFPLIYVSKDATKGEKQYRIAHKSDWIIKHHVSIDQWQVYHPDGQVYIYGDGSLTTHISHGVEHNVKWGNWIGSSTIIEGQEQLPISYNLSAIEDIYGEQVQFFYEQENEHIGKFEHVKESCIEHTRAIYLSKVVGLRGKTLNFKYDDKEASEYYDPHTEKENHLKPNEYILISDDRDAYQERYQTKYLSSIQLKNRVGSSLGEVNLEYSFLKQGTELQKRLLTTITYKDTQGKAYKPSKEFDYFGLKETDGVKAGFTGNPEETRLYDPSTGALYAAIKQQTLPEGISYAYHYGKQKIKGSSTDIAITFPKETENKNYGGIKSPWSAPELFYGSDYVVAIFESQDLTKRLSHVKVYQWIGDRWIEQDLGQYEGYFYDRYQGKDQYSKSTLKTMKEKIFEVIEDVAPEAMGVINAFEDTLKDEAKTFYKVGDDIVHGQNGDAIKDWYAGQFTALKDIALDIASGFEQEAEQLKILIDGLFGSTAAQFTDHQKKLYEARDKDAAKHPRKTYHITLQDNFFSLTSTWGSSQVIIVHKNPLISGDWKVNPENITLTSKFFTFDSGDNFVVLLDEVTDFIYIYSWDGLIWSTYSRQLRTDFTSRIKSISGKSPLAQTLDIVLGTTEDTKEAKLDHRSAISAKNNLIIAVITDSHGINADVSLLYHDENMNWESKGTQLNKKEAILGDKMDLAIYEEKIPLFSNLLGKDGKIDLKIGNSFAVLQTYDNINEQFPGADDIPIIGTFIGDFLPDMKKINSTYGIVWDENYDNIRIDHLHTAAGQTGVESFIVGDVIHKIGKAHSLMVGSSDALAPSDGKNYAFRYTGKRFLSGEFASPYYSSGFSNDITSSIVESSDKTAKIPKFHQYDPYSESWKEIENASTQEIKTSEYINEAISVSIELLNIVVLVATIVIPGLGEAVLAAETIETITNAANMIGLASMVMEPVSKELVKDIMGTNHKSTAISNNYISVNGKLFHRQSNGSWISVSHDIFELDKNTTLVGGSNSIVNNYVPYTLKTPRGIENHSIRLRNGQVYESRTLPSNRIVHQDSISATVGSGAYVSYGPVGSNGFVKQNDYLNRFQPIIGKSAEVRSRNNHPSYKEAKEVTLHKVVGDSFADTSLYDYPVTKVTIKEADRSLSYHYYQYDSNTSAYHSASRIAFYGKVIDIPSGKDYALNTIIPLTNTDGGYTEHYYYNRYNSYGSTGVSRGYPATPAVLKLTDSTLVSYQSSYTSDTHSFEKGFITPLDGHPYATLMYNSTQDIVTQDYTYYKVWRENLTHKLDGKTLQVSGIYNVRPIQKISVLDGVSHKTKYTYTFSSSSNHMMLKEEIVEGTTTDGRAETHKTRYTYGSEHYPSLLDSNRLSDHYMIVSSVKKGLDSEIITSVDVTGYEYFSINDKSIFLPKNYYKASESQGVDYYTNTEGIVGDIVREVNNQEATEIAYEEKAIATHKGYIETHEAADLILRKQDDQKNEIQQLNTELHELAKAVDKHKERIGEDNANVAAIQREIEELHGEVDKINESIEDKSNQITREQDAISTYRRNINLGWIGGLIGYGIAYGVNHHKINEANDRISSLRYGIRQLKENLGGKKTEISSKRTSATGYLTDSANIQQLLQALEEALQLETQEYHTLKDHTEHSLSKSHQALKEYHRITLDTDKHESAKSHFQTIQNDSLHDKYIATLEGLNTTLDREIIIQAVNPQTPQVTVSLKSILVHSGVDTYNLIKEKIKELKTKIGKHKTTQVELSGHHQVIIDYKKELLVQGEQSYVSYPYKWVKTKTIVSRDSKTGIPVVIKDEKDVAHSIVLEQ